MADETQTLKQEDVGSLPPGVTAPAPPTPEGVTDQTEALPDNTHSPAPSGVDEPHANPDQPSNDVKPGEPAPQPSPVAEQSPAEALPPPVQPPEQVAEVPVPEVPEVPEPEERSETALGGFMREVVEGMTALKEENAALRDRLDKLEGAPTGGASNLDAVEQRVDQIDGKLTDQDKRISDVASSVLHEQELLSFRDDLAGVKQSVGALGDRTEKLEQGFKEVAKVADDLRSADLDVRMKKAEDAIAKGGTGGSDTTLAKLFAGDEDTAKEMASKLDHLWKQNGNA